MTAQPDVEGLILHKHGIFTFGESAREAYERMIALVTLAEERLEAKPQGGVRHRAIAAGDRARRRGGADPARRLQPRGRQDRRRMAPPDSRLPQQSGDPRFRQRRRACALRPGRRGDARPHHPHQELAADRGAPEDGKLGRLQAAPCATAAQAFVESYQAYFARNNARAGGIKKMLDPLPRVALVPGLGLFGLGRSKKDARDCRRSRAMPRSRPSPMPRRSDASSRSPKPTCSTWSIGRSSRPSSARRWRSRSPARSR